MHRQLSEAREPARVGAHGFGELVVALLTMGGGQIARCVRDDLQSDLAGVHIGNALGAELKKPVIEPWNGFEAFIAGIELGIGDAGEKMLFKCDYRPGTFQFWVW